MFESATALFSVEDTSIAAMRRQSDLRSHLLLVGSRSKKPYAGGRSLKGDCPLQYPAVTKKSAKRESNTVMRSGSLKKR
jgi:hypothetical protein